MYSTTPFLCLFLSLFCITVIIYLIQGLDVLQPNVIVSGTMSLSVLLAAINVERWYYGISLLTFNSIIFGVLAFCLGGLTANNSWTKKLRKKNGTPYQYRKGLFSKNTFILGLIVVLGVLSLYNWFSVVEIAKQFGSNGEYHNVFKTLRYAIEHELVEYPSRSMVYANYVAQTFAFCYVFIFVKNVIYGGINISVFKYLLPVLMYIPFIIMTTGRILILGLVTYTLTVFTILYYQKHNFNLESRLKALCILIIGGCSFIILFLVLGNFTGKTVTLERTPLVIISHYAGLSIPALDVWLRDIWIENQYIGSYTLNNIYRILMRLGFELPPVDIFLPFTQFNNIDTNVYTAIGRYIRDFGYLGMFCLMYMLGVCFTWAYQYASRSNNSYIIMLYGAFSYPLFLMSIEERFFIDIFGMPLLYMMCFLYFSYRIIYFDRYGE